MNNIKHTLVHHFLEESARQHPDKVALIVEDNRATYGEINRQAHQVASWLVHQGMKKGDRVVMVLHNSLEYVVSYYGIMKAGGVPVSMSTLIKADGLKPLLDELGAFIIISSARFEPMILEAGPASFGIKSALIKKPEKSWPASVNVFSWDDIASGKDDTTLSVQIQDIDLCSIIYTSGSTGTPKGVMLSHRNIVTNVSSICEYLKLTEADIQMVVLPFFYVMGKSLLNTHFAAGGTVVINNRFAFTASVLKQMSEENVTGFSGVPSTYAYLLHRSPLKSYGDRLPSLRYCSQAGGHMAKQIKEDLRNALPDHTDIYIMYGATEASARLTYLEPDKMMDKIESIGRAIPGVTMRVIDEQGNQVPSGTVGELAGSGPNIMQGYWKDEELSRKVLDHNGYHTGDLGYMDGDGYLYLVGRKDNLLKVSGHRINPQEIEDIIMETGLVVETAVVGLPDDLLGNRLAAVVVAIEKETIEEDILKLCRKKLPSYKIPGQFVMVKALPKKASGKIDREECKNISALD